jgi:hypothetical protein
VLLAAGDQAAALDLLGAAAERFDAKGNVVSAGLARRRLESVAVGA